MLGYSYLGGAALERVEARRWWLFQRGLPVQEGRAIPLDFFDASPPRRWVRHCHTPAGAHYLLGLFNWDGAHPLDTSVHPAEWGVPAAESYLFFDFWSEQLYGPARALPGLLAPFTSRILQVQPLPTQPALVGNSRHVTGQVGIEHWQWSPESHTLEGVFAGAPGSAESYYIWLPGNEGMAECQGAIVEYIRPHLIRLALQFDGTGRQAWSLLLDSAIPVP